MLTSSQRIYAEAARFFGVKEVPGDGSHPLIKEWIRASATWLNPDDSKTAWCACFRGAVGLATGTGVPKEHYRAASWKTWGRPVPSLASAMQGDTVILDRRGGKHVGVIHRIAADHQKVWLLGGNQSDSVSIAPFSAHLIEAIRR